MNDHVKFTSLFEKEHIYVGILLYLQVHVPNFYELSITVSTTILVPNTDLQPLVQSTYIQLNYDKHVYTCYGVALKFYIKNNYNIQMTRYFLHVNTYSECLYTSLYKTMI